ncbi:hypothetical protein [Pseudaestuariivita atlantica]|uniref:Uncharacterized protein n=1 Tax=Pseudaestuariivita atlantica TaxID=1317121 RepID=A0A0L1JUW9_9RHOB|nr:hypothetical protein [Pseudaestuariivita atlantica]KNG95203.1 hypothetical protein ATO11_00740 [Pseudaestuariivita atlantica]
MFGSDTFQFHGTGNGVQGSVDPYTRADNPNSVDPDADGDMLYGENGDDRIDWSAYRPTIDPDADTRVNDEVAGAAQSGTVLDPDIFG